MKILYLKFKFQRKVQTIIKLPLWKFSYGLGSKSRFSKRTYLSVVVCALQVPSFAPLTSASCSLALQLQKGGRKELQQNGIRGCSSHTIEDVDKVLRWIEPIPNNKAKSKANKRACLFLDPLLSNMYLFYLVTHFIRTLTLSCHRLSHNLSLLFLFQVQPMITKDNILIN